MNAVSLSSPHLEGVACNLSGSLCLSLYLNGRHLPKDVWDFFSRSQADQTTRFTKSRSQSDEDSETENSRRDSGEADNVDGDVDDDHRRAGGSEPQRRLEAQLEQE
jgi:hypothetical protein